VGYIHGIVQNGPTCLQSCAQVEQFSPAVHVPSPQNGDFCRPAVEAAAFGPDGTASEAAEGGSSGVTTVSSNVFCRPQLKACMTAGRCSQSTRPCKWRQVLRMECSIHAEGIGRWRRMGGPPFGRRGSGYRAAERPRTPPTPLWRLRAAMQPRLGGRRCIAPTYTAAPAQRSASKIAPCGAFR
jgi:hypothetical protein